MKDSREALIGSSVLLPATLIRGAAFMAQNKGMDYVYPFNNNTAGSILFAVILSQLKDWEKETGSVQRVCGQTSYDLSD